MEDNLKPSSDKGILSLEGELTIGHAEELKRVMIDALDSSDHVTVSLEEVTAADLSFLQLLCSAHRTALKSGKQFTLSSKDSDIFKQAANDAGYTRHESCALNPNQNCLWCGG